MPGTLKLAVTYASMSDKKEKEGSVTATLQEEVAVREQKEKLLPGTQEVTAVTYKKYE